MQLQDGIRLASSALITQRTRSLLTALGIAVGIAAVVLLTAIGEGIHHFVVAEFTQFGTNLLSIAPGKTTTHGMPGAVISNVRPLSVDDATALRRIPQVVATVPVVQGNAAVEFKSHTRRVTVYGVGTDALAVWKARVAQGQFLPADDPSRARPLAVLGSTLRQELFKQQNPLGATVKIGEHYYRVIGTMESKGQFLGFDLDDSIFIPAGRALELFNRDSLMEIDLIYAAGADPDHVAEQVRRLLIARHGNEDLTITTQEQMLETLNSILNVLTLAVAALGSISLLVGAIGVLTIMTIAVNERVGEIGLLRALGASQRQILGLFLGEAVALAALGGLAGLILGVGGAWLIGWLVPALPVQISLFYLGLAAATSVVIGLVSGLAPARRAAGLDPVDALRTE